jgi:succinate dehydrogenase / fumarate reductase cytochrome b subunit
MNPSGGSSFLLKRLMSFTGMVPVGAFLLQHLFSNSYAFLSEEAYNEHTRFLTGLPLVVLLELSLIYLPIALHAGLGLAIVYRGESNVASYGIFRNWMFFFQRLSGIVALAFIAVHSYSTRIRSFFTGDEVLFADMARTLEQPFWFWFYFVGVVMVCFHFANGLWSFLVTWGVTTGPKAQRASAALTMLLFVLTGIWAVSILFRFT